MRMQRPNCLTLPSPGQVIRSLSDCTWSHLLTREEEEKGLDANTADLQQVVLMTEVQESSPERRPWSGQRSGPSHLLSATLPTR